MSSPPRPWQRAAGSPLAIATAICSRTTTCERSGFRGTYPAASLKRAGRAVRSHPHEGLPRDVPRGLIEASRRARCPTSDVRGFRGTYPAASLKQLRMHHQTNIAGGFRGTYPAASLKRHDGPVARVQGPRGLPRDVPRGLIEAKEWERSGGAQAARLQRDVPRGLIEASRPRRRPRAARRGFRGTLPRGLIEASSASDSGASSRRGGFRGTYPAASLKRHHTEGAFGG